MRMRRRWKDYPDRPAAPAVFRALVRTWGVPDDLGDLWWRALTGAKWSKAISWRQQVQLYQSVTLFLSQISAPQVVMEVLENLHREQRLSRHQTSQIEAYILRWVTATGTWRE